LNRRMLLGLLQIMNEGWRHDCRRLSKSKKKCADCTSRKILSQIKALYYTDRMNNNKTHSQVV
jgi:hypothetical protein